MSTSFSATTPSVPPVPCTKNATGSYIPPLTTEQWEVQGVDDFWKMYTENTSHWQAQGLMPTFFKDFSGGIQGDGVQYQCATDNEVDCSMLQSCSLIATGPESWLLPYTVQAYYVWAAMTSFSKIMNQVWQALEWAVPDMNGFAFGIGQKFEVTVPGATTWSKVFPILNTILTLFAVIFIILDPLVDVALGVRLHWALRKFIRRLIVHV